MVISYALVSVVVSVAAVGFLAAAGITSISLLLLIYAVSGVSASLILAWWGVPPVTRLGNQ